MTHVGCSGTWVRCTRVHILYEYMYMYTYIVHCICTIYMYVHIVACSLPGSTTLEQPHKPGPEIRFLRAKLEGFYSAQTAQDSLECSTAMRSGFIDCAGARRENRRPLDCQRGQPAGSVWVRTGAPTGPQPRRRHNIKGFTPFHFYSICNTLL